jgi:(p)ppGpp synthase/HD superfamily hydrolase
VNNVNYILSYLATPCKALVFARQKIEAADNSFDVELHRACKFDIGKFCSNQDGDRVLDCLSNTKILRVLQKGCQKIVKERLLERVEDDRLNPTLIEACHEEAQR